MDRIARAYGAGINMKRPNKRRMKPNGRSVHDSPYINIPWVIYDLPAVRALSSSAFRAWVHLMRYHFGHNNGEIAMSARRLEAAVGMNKNTAHRALEELRAHGLIALTSKGRFQGRIASTYRLTHIKTANAEASREYKHWNQEAQKLIVS